MESIMNKNSFKRFINELRNLLYRISRVVLIKDMIALDRPWSIDVWKLDYVRYSTLELIARDIMENQIEGQVAEVGVYRGDFASKVNFLFPDRKLYLFDTFEGFPENHAKIDVEKGFSSASQDWSNTSVELVLQRMPYPSNVIIKKGIFPESAADVNDKFCFVSLDVDLYLPIKEGLKFFYPLLSPGGVIMVHDFNNYGYKGVRNAVLEFCRDNQVAYIPIPDAYGSVIIRKNL